MGRTELPDHELLTPREVAAYYRVTVSTIRRWVAEGKIRAKRVGGRILIPRGEVEKLEKMLSD